MSNMSYCRMSNTAADLADCVEALRDGEYEDTDEIGDSELRGLKNLVDLARELVGMREVSDILDNS